ncbi:MAG: hypothetical protein L0Y71_22700 [Gemmataceae bacterium]|nr:hypothetical protein [Gemmataceae bacterium]
MLVRSSVLLGSLCLLAAAPAFAQLTFNEREVKSAPSKLDKADVWSFDFRFKDPRLIKVHVPGRGTRICWYMWYQVINRTGVPKDFVPIFELVTFDPPAVYLDEVLPTAEAAIRRAEDTAGVQDIKNSVLMQLTKIPPSKPAEEAYPRAVTGVAIWDGSAADAKGRDPNTKDLSDATRFSIFVRGLSNGYVVVDPPAPGLPPITRYKTLQLNFERQGERFSVDARDIKFKAPAEWIYRAANRSRTLAVDKVDKVKAPEKKEGR